VHAHFWRDKGVWKGVVTLHRLFIRSYSHTPVRKSCSSADINKRILVHAHFWRGKGVWKGTVTLHVLFIRPLHAPFLLPCSHTPVPQSCSSVDMSKRILVHTHFWRDKGVWTGAVSLHRLLGRLTHTRRCQRLYLLVYEYTK
jgi:hypothetical protein